MTGWFTPVLSLFQSNTPDIIDRPLIVVDVGNTMGSPDRGLNTPLYHRLAAYHRKGAEIIIGSDGTLDAVTGFQALLDQEGLDSGIFTDILTPRTNRHRTKDSRTFWPALLTRFRRDARQVVLIDDKINLLDRARQFGIQTFQVTDIPSSEASLTDLDALLAAPLSKHTL